MDKGINLIKSVFFSANEGIIISDRHGKITAANPRSAEMFGYSVSELETLTINDLVPHSVKDGHSATRERYFKHPVPRPMGVGKDLHGLKSNNEIFPLEISLSHFVEEGQEYVTAFITDISYRKKLEIERLKYMEKLEEIVELRTESLKKVNEGLLNEVNERKATELALRESQQLYELIASNYPNGSINILDKNFNYLVAGGKDLISQRKIRPDERTGKPFLSGFEEDKQKQLKIYLQNGLKGIPGSYEHVAGNSTVIMHIVPIKNSMGMIDKLLVVEENITDQKIAEDEIRKALSKERELNEMKSRFVSMASHEFRTPLATILSSTNLMARYISGTANEDKMDKHVGRIRSNIKSLTDILNDFLSLEKLESGLMNVELKETDVCLFIDELVEETMTILKEGQYFDVQSSPDFKYFRTDPKILKNIMLNVISNASKYSDVNQKITINIKNTSSGLEISVTDDGIGVPEAEQIRMFERFFRAKNAANIQGTGLGLFIVNKYVKLLNGEVSMDSEEGSGTTVKILLKNG
ncbi:MAG: PAS domain-containing sensor histidine kinase [Cyclobacteriaceae bacterium]